MAYRVKDTAQSLELCLNGIFLALKLRKAQMGCIPVGRWCTSWAGGHSRCV